MTEDAFARIREAIGEIPIVPAEERARDEATSPNAEKAEGRAASPSRKVLADGTYATESAFILKSPTVALGHKHPIRSKGN